MKNKPFLYIFITMFFVFSGSFAFGQAADLQISIKCPGSAAAGQNLKTSITVYVTNSGKTPAENFAVDLIISKNSSAPMAFAVYSANFAEDALLLGGREHVKFLGPGQTKQVTLYGNNRIPADTPDGSYFLGAVADPGNSIRETNERNNMDFCSIRIKGAGTGTPGKADIDITDVYLDEHCRIWIKHTNNGTVKIDKVFRERVWVDGVLKTDDTEHIILLPGKWTAHGVGADPGVKVAGTAKVKAQVDVDNVLIETNEANNIMTRTLECSKIKPMETRIPVITPVIKPGLLKPVCPDPAAYEINFEILERTATFTGRVKITGVVKNIGSMAFSGGGGMAYLYENNDLKATKAFGYLAAGASIPISYVRSWYASSPNEGEFPPVYKLLIQYDPDILKDGNKNNDDCNLNNNKKERSGAAINEMFR